MPNLSDQSYFYGGGQVASPANNIKTSGAPNSKAGKVGWLAYDPTAATGYYKVNNTTWIGLGGGAGSFTTLSSTGATTLATTGASVNTIGNTTGATSVTISAGTGGIVIVPTAGNISVAPVTGSAASANITLNGRLGQSTHTGLTTAAAASQIFVITNSAITATNSSVQVTAANLGSNDAQMTVTRVIPANGTLTVTLKNNGAAALNGDVQINFWILN